MATAPSCEPLLHKSEDRAAILNNQLQPSEAAHLRKVNSAKANSCNENVYALVERLVHAGPPVRVEYRLTEKGDALSTILLDLNRWALKWIDLPGDH